MSDGWEQSAAAWIAHVGERGDYGRQFVLDAPMLDLIRAKQVASALDVGCGEGRFCRIMQAEGIRTLGIDPSEALLRRARQLDPHGDYRIGNAEALDLPPEAFDLVISYLSLIDIADVERAISEMVRVLVPRGTLLIANLNSFFTASVGDGWTHDPNGERRFCIDHYLTERCEWVAWRGIRIQNWHRPLSRYMTLLLAAGLNLRHFTEPSPIGGDAAEAERYRRVPNYVLMEWEKPSPP